VKPAARHVFRWDLDKTYLRTEFDSFGDLVKSAVETAADKQAYPGATGLLRTLSTSEGYRVCIISGSPTQMRTVLAAKLALDGVAYDEFVLKNNLKNILRGRFRSLRAQVPYKLPALLSSRAGSPPAPAETLFGDDAEADAIIYFLYADILGGRVPVAELTRILESARAYPDEIEQTVALARRAPGGDVVRRIVIHLDRRSPTQPFRRFGPRLVPVYNYFQAALVLYADGVLDARQVMFIAFEMLDSKQYQLSTLANSLQDLMRRNRLAGDVVLRLSDEVRAQATGEVMAARPELPPFDAIARSFADRVRELRGAPPPAWPSEPEHLDYVSLVDQEHTARREKKRGR
jgi:hypothetical protein